MVMNATERLMARRQVAAEIRTDPVEVAMIRREKIDDGAGGWRWDDESTQPPITVLIMPAKRRMGEMLTNTELGDVINYPFILLAHHNDDVRRGDHFYWEGDLFQVAVLHIKDEVSKTAQIDYYAGTKNA